MLPGDTNILVSYLNTLLRDKYEDLTDLCLSLDEDEDALKTRLLAAGWRYDADARRFARDAGANT